MCLTGQGMGSNNLKILRTSYMEAPKLSAAYSTLPAFLRDFCVPKALWKTIPLSLLPFPTETETECSRNWLSLRAT